jgi:hypothetical protein
MDDEEKQELIRKLSDSREFANQLLNMEKSELRKIEQKVTLATGILDGVNDALFSLTGDEFYNKQGGGGENGN